jgi:dolichyl-phosphate-mannose-protein mannosyltransferase
MTLTLEHPGSARTPDRRTRDSLRPPRWLPAAGPFVLMLTLGLLGCTRPVLSWDEIATADAAGRSVGQIWQLLQHIDGVFGPYYLAMHLWTGIAGDSVLSLRFPSVLAMAGAAALTGELGRRLAGPAAGMLAGALLCLLPNMSRYAAEARPYAIACLFSVGALLLLHRAAERPGFGRWAAYAAAVVALGAASLVALTALAGHFAMLLVSIRRAPHRRRALLLPWCAATISAIVLLAPLVWWGWHQRPAQLHWVPPMSLGAVYTFPGRLTGSTELAWLLIGLLVVAVCRPTGAVAQMAAAAALPAAFVCAISFAGPSFWVNRYLLFVLLPAVIAAAAGLARLRLAGAPQAAVVLAVFAAAALPGQLTVRRPTVKNGSDYRTLAAVIQAGQQRGDVVVYHRGRTMRTGVAYYLRHDADRPRDVLLRRSAAESARLTADEYADPVPRLAAARRIWLVAFGRPADPATGRPDLAPLLSGGFERSGLWQVKNGTVALYTRLPRPAGTAATARTRR